MAYQGYGHGLGRAAVEVLHRLVVGAFRPDLTLVLDLTVAEGLARAQGRGHAEDRYERSAIALPERLRAGVHQLLAREPRSDKSRVGKGVCSTLRSLWSPANIKTKT